MTQWFLLAFGFSARQMSLLLQRPTVVLRSWFKWTSLVCPPSSYVMYGIETSLKSGVSQANLGFPPGKVKLGKRASFQSGPRKGRFLGMKLPSWQAIVTL